MCRHGVKMSYKYIGELHFMHMRAELMECGYAILESFVDLCVPKEIVAEFTASRELQNDVTS